MALASSARLADEEDAAREPQPNEKRASTENAPAVVPPHARHGAVDTFHHERAESDETDQLGVSLGKLVDLFVGRGTVAAWSHLCALGEAPRDLLLALQFTTSVVKVEDPLARRSIHALTGGVERERTPIEDVCHVALTELLLQIGQGRHRRVGDVDAVVVLGQSVAVRGLAAPIRVTAFLHGGLRERGVVVVEDELNDRAEGRLSSFGRESQEGLERRVELGSDLLQRRGELQQPAEHLDHRTPIFFALHGHTSFHPMARLSPRHRAGATDSPCFSAHKPLKR